MMTCGLTWVDSKGEGERLSALPRVVEVLLVASAASGVPKLASVVQRDPRALNRLLGMITAHFSRGGFSDDDLENGAVVLIAHVFSHCEGCVRCCNVSTKLQ